ncbi:MULTISPECIES: hypothetical protein [unclassified Pseudodesulfovibrio]|uniref:hypothetical protein n=1 Tax=unclassified Pseudodesulfovibrio TaxID=2661612 RepID=UPI000FEC211B|nr:MULTISPECIES: hypothetical protein [unclassified Pseudodesulfovibrio]MCJ2166332.1 hypothetical protein [Pseudodesulfovibrio sp. S3-i]RWU03842.1 hypothetical protein DWB63_10330 [Pseudodesulfovibrio sp. S3]
MDKIRLMLEWLTSPLWYSNDSGAIYTLEADDLPIDDKLKRDIKKWNKVFQSTYVQEDPSEIGFSSKSANRLLTQALEEEGQYLYPQLKKQLAGKYIVTYKK